MLQKQSAPLNFAQGLDTKTDPKQVPFGKFLRLVNSIFTKAGLLLKRNGYKKVGTVSGANFLTTFNDNLTAIGSSLEAFNQANMSFINKGSIQPLELSVLPVGRSAINQVQCDSAIASNGLVCTAYTENNNGTKSYKYVIQDSLTGQNIVNPTAIPPGSGAVDGSPRVFLLGGYFVIVFSNTISAVEHLQYISISISNPTTVSAPADIAASYIASAKVSWDGVVVGNKLYVAYNTTSGGQAIKITYLNSSFSVAAAVSFASSIATIMSMCADLTNPASPVIYAAYYDVAGPTGNVVAVDQNLNKLMTETQILNAGTIDNITCTAKNGAVSVVYEVDNNYSYDAGVPTHYLKIVPVTLPATVTTGSVGSTTVLLRSVGLASKAFLMNSTMYMLGTYQSNTQNTYFLFDSSGNVISRLAYQNGGGYLGLGLPQAQVSGSSVSVAYLFKDLIQSTSTAGLAQSIGQAGFSNIYSQTGINLASYNFSQNSLSVAEIGSSLALSGGMMWSYDGQTVSEQGFHLYPSSVELVGSSTSGGLIVQQYFYQATYEWTDAAGNINRSAPSIPVSFTIVTAAVSFTGNRTSGSPTLTTVSSFTGLQVGQPISGTGIPANTYILALNPGGSTLTMSANATSGTSTATTVTPVTLASLTVNVPTLRLTYKTNVKIVIYRWSAAQQNYYQITSITAPTLNDKTTDSIAFVDSLSDAQILGNNLIYTTGSVLENTPGPACSAIDLFDNRVWAISAEDNNLLIASKQIIEGTPIEISDLLSLYIAPTTGAQGSTGAMKCLFPMDDKQIIFKKNAIYYFNGSGPDNTGNNSQYSQPIFITSSVGCSNQNSIVLIPQGLMFQSDKGIWLLGRDLNTSYIGAPVEAFNSSLVNSAVVVPGTTQVRFTLSSGETLMYDYFYQQWGTFEGAPALGSTLYQGLHTLINSSGEILQETPGEYLDNNNPVLMSFLTSWMNLAGLQGYQRAYFFYLLGQYISPHKLQIGIAYDYNPSFYTAPLITPTNSSSAYGEIGPYGQQGPYGGAGDLERWRVFFKRQRCQAFQISIQEVYDGSRGITAGAGFTLSGLNLIFGTKSSFRPTPADKSVG